MSEVIRFHQKTLFSGLTGTIDHENCVVHGVSLITAGITATGHDLFVDDTSVNTFHDMGSQMGQLPVNLDHGSGIMSMNGYIDNFRKDNGKWRGDWHLLKTHDETPVMLERCERQPGTFGFSLAFSGDKKGVLRFGKKCAHPEALLSADCVVRPAANKSLFSVPVDRTKNVERNIELQTDMPNTQDLQNQPSLADLMAQIQQLTQLVTQQGEAIGQLQQGGQQEEQYEFTPEDTAELTRLYNLTDEQLAAEGVDREQLNQAVAQHDAWVGAQGDSQQGEQSQEGSEGQEGELATAAPAGMESGAPGGATALSAVHRELIQLKAAYQRDLKQRQDEKEAIQFKGIEGQMIQLASQRDEALAERARIIELAEVVMADNECLRIAQRTGTRPVTAGVDEGIRLFSANGSGQLHPYQAKLKAIMLSEKCSEGKAINFADKDDNGALHADWLQSLSANRTIHA